MAYPLLANNKRVNETSHDSDLYMTKTRRKMHHSTEDDRPALFSPMMAQPFRGSGQDINALRTLDQANRTQRHVNSGTTTLVFRLSALSQELLDIVFAHPYHTSNGKSVKYKGHSKMTVRRLNWNHGKDVRIPYHVLNIVSLLVSKRYFVLAATALARAQTIEEKSAFPSLSGCTLPKGIMGAFMQHAILELVGLSPERIR